MKKIIFLFVSALFSLLNYPSIVSAQQIGSVPLYHVTVMGGIAQAVHYTSLNGTTRVDFKGTILLPKAHGKAMIKRSGGVINIEAEFYDLQPANKFGYEYLTYVLWAVSPEGRAANLGEVLLDGTKSKLTVTTQLQSFALVVTAEPYFAVTEIGDVVVVENVVREDTVGKISEIKPNHKLLSRGQYVLNVNSDQTKPVKADKKMPFYLYQARNAVTVARWSGAEAYATEPFNKAEQLLRRAEVYQLGKKNLKKQVPIIAREAIQTAEDARIIAQKRHEDERIFREREDAAQQINRAAELIRQEVSRRTQLEAEVAAAHQAKISAEQAKTEAEDEEVVAVQEQQAAKAEAEEARVDAQKSEFQRVQTEREKAELRAKLMEQLNVIIETRDTARGLIINLSEVLFETGKFIIRPPMREKLAKISGVLLAHPGLELEIEGHTDSVGSDEYNQRLSEDRAVAVRDYLIEQGILGTSVSFSGFGETAPIATNDTPEGRQKNRRVELIVSGGLIGDKLNPVPETK